MATERHARIMARPNAVVGFFGMIRATPSPSREGRRVKPALSLGVILLPALCGLGTTGMQAGGPHGQPAGRTSVTIQGEDFHLNGAPTLKGRRWREYRLEGLLLNARMVQGIFDDLNPETRARWAYPDTGRWDPERNTREFVAAMPAWRDHGLLAFTINLQGGSPEGYSKGQPWHNSALRRGRRAAARLHGPAREDPRPGRRAGHGRHPRRLLLRPGPAAAGRGGGRPGRGQRRWTGSSTAATATS